MTLLERVRAAGVTAFVVDDATGCWEWTGTKSKHGYPHGYKYRIAWEAINGPRPEGFGIHHVCKNPGCVNPEHLEALSRRDHDVEHFLRERVGLTLDDVAEIRRLGTVPGVLWQDVAAQFGIGGSTVRYYWRGERWAPELGSHAVRPVGRVCPHCGGDFAPEKNRHAKFCTKKCQIAAWRKANPRKKKASRA